MPAVDYADKYRKLLIERDGLHEELLSQRRKTSDAHNELSIHAASRRRMNMLESLVRVADGFMFQVGAYLEDGSRGYGVAVVTRKELQDALDMGELDALVDSRKALAQEAAGMQRADPAEDQESLIALLGAVHNALNLDPERGESDVVGEIESLIARAEAAEAMTAGLE